jgi:hypothetical protein
VGLLQEKQISLSEVDPGLGGESLQKAGAATVIIMGVAQENGTDILRVETQRADGVDQQVEGGLHRGIQQQQPVTGIEEIGAYPAIPADIIDMGRDVEGGLPPVPGAVAAGAHIFGGPHKNIPPGGKGPAHQGMDLRFLTSINRVWPEGKQKNKKFFSVCFLTRRIFLAQANVCGETLDQKITNDNLISNVQKEMEEIQSE